MVDAVTVVVLLETLGLKEPMTVTPHPLQPPMVLPPAGLVLRMDRASSPADLATAGLTGPKARSLLSRTTSIPMQTIAMVPRCSSPGPTHRLDLEIAAAEVQTEMQTPPSRSLIPHLGSNNSLKGLIGNSSCFLTSISSNNLARSKANVDRDKVVDNPTPDRFLGSREGINDRVRDVILNSVINSSRTPTTSATATIRTALYHPEDLAVV